MVNNEQAKQDKNSGLTFTNYQLTPGFVHQQAPIQMLLQHSSGYYSDGRYDQFEVFPDHTHLYSLSFTSSLLVQYLIA